MRVVSLNVGLPRTMVWRGREVRTGIFKQPVAGSTLLGRSNLDGERQADLENHGGRVKAVYVYPAEHYEFWRAQLPEAELRWSMDRACANGSENVSLMRQALRLKWLPAGRRDHFVRQVSSISSQ
jgi:MOSC domain-containing protein YiiM